MAHGVTAGISLLMAISIYALMQVFAKQLAGTQSMTILGGFFGANGFVFLTTAISNIEMEIFGPHYQMRLFPEVIIALLISMFASGLVHRVCVSTCIIFSLVFLFYMNKVSVKRYGPSTVPQESATVGKKKK